MKIDMSWPSLAKVAFGSAGSMKPAQIGLLKSGLNNFTELHSTPENPNSFVKVLTHNLGLWDFCH